MVTVRCEACGDTVGIAEHTCSACGRPVSRALREELAARLAAASAPFRALEDAVHGAAFAVLVLGVVHLGFGMFLFALERSADLAFDPDVPTDSGRRLACNLALGAGLLACALVARLAPAGGLLAALAWAALCLGASRADGGSSGSALGMVFGVASHAFLIAMVYRGVASAVRGRIYAGALARRAPARRIGDPWDDGYPYRHGPAAPGAPDETTPWLARLSDRLFRVVSATGRQPPCAGE